MLKGDSEEKAISIHCANACDLPCSNAANFMH